MEIISISVERFEVRGNKFFSWCIRSVTGILEWGKYIQKKAGKVGGKSPASGGGKSSAGLWVLVFEGRRKFRIVGVHAGKEATP